MVCTDVLVLICILTSTAERTSTHLLVWYRGRERCEHEGLCRFPVERAHTFSQALVYYNPKRIAITGGYMGTRATIKTFKEIRPDLVFIELDDEYEEGDLCWLETPLNPTGESRYGQQSSSLSIGLPRVG
jgi:hypothetical protein